MSDDDQYYRRKLEVASERDLDSLAGIQMADRPDRVEEMMASPDQTPQRSSPKSHSSSDHVQMDVLTARQAQRRHQMSQWGIEFQSSPVDSRQETYSTVTSPQRDRRDEHIVDSTDSSSLRQEVKAPSDAAGQATRQAQVSEVRTPRYVSRHSNYEEMLDKMSPMDPFQGEYIPSGKKKLVSLNRSVSLKASEDRGGKVASRRSRAQTEDRVGEENTEASKARPPLEDRERRTRRKKKRGSKLETTIPGTGTSTETYTVVEGPGTYENSAYEAEPMGKPLSGSHTKKRKKHKRHSDVPVEKTDSLECESVKSNGTYTVPRSDSRAQLLNLSSMSRLSAPWKKKKKKSHRELSRANTGLSAVKSSQNQVSKQTQG